MTIQLPISLKKPSNFNYYLAYVNSQPRLNETEEKKLFLAYQNNNDLNAVQQIILSHLRFVAYVARSYKGYGLPMADLMQEGTVGLMKAVKKFKLEHGVRLCSYAVHYIKAEIQEFIVKNWRLVKSATTKAKRKLFFNLRRLKSSTEWLNETEKQDIVKRLEVSETDINEMEVQMSQPDLFIHSSTVQDEESTAYQMEHLLEDHSASPENAVLQDDFHLKALTKVKTVVEQLDQRSKDIIMNRWFSTDRKIHQYFADKYKVSNERIRQIEERALAQIRKKLLGFKT